MDKIKYSYARQNLKSILDNVIDNNIAVDIQSLSGNCVLISRKEYDRMIDVKFHDPEMNYFNDMGV